MQRAITIYWHSEENHLCHIHTLPKLNVIKISNIDYNYIKEHYFFDLLVKITNKKIKNELETSIHKAIYWFGKTQHDETLESKWIHLWSCMESIFTIKDDQITETNTIGIASLLIYGGYNIDFLGDYQEIKKKIKDYYKKRCKIVHAGVISIISNSDIENFSVMVAWIIISVAALCDRGYDSKQKVLDQAFRLDKITSKKNLTKN